MKRLQKSRSGTGKKKLLRMIKKGTACLLVLVLTLSPAIPSLAVTAVVKYSDKEEPDELPDDNLPDGGACESTAYTWVLSTIQAGMQKRGASGSGERPSGTSRRFDLCGLLNGVTEYSDKGISTTYHDSSQYPITGYETLIKVDGKTHKADGDHNGAVEKLSDPGNPGSDKDLGLELKISLSSSPDNNYVFVDYYVQDISGKKSEGEKGRLVQLGTGCDDKIGGGTGNPDDDDDGATLYKNERGFHMVNRNTNTTFDCITNDESLGITNDESPGITEGFKRWIGPFAVNNPDTGMQKDFWGEHIFDNSERTKTEQYDSAMAYSWTFHLRPYEIVHKRVAFAVRATSYYVSKDGDDSDPAHPDDKPEVGTYTKPFKTIQHALDRLSGKGYIFIMDEGMVAPPCTIDGSEKDITIASTDFDRSGKPINNRKTLKREKGCDEPLFTVSGGATLKLMDISLDGNKVSSGAPLVKVESEEGGSLEINSGAEIKNCVGTSGSRGSAVNITGGASLSINQGTVSGNVSEGLGAVYFDGSSFDVTGNVSVTDNTRPDGKEKANVYLTKGKFVTVDGDLGSSSIGVTAEQKPDASSSGIPTEPGQEVKIASPKEGSAVDKAPCVFVDNFTADQKDNGIDVKVGTKDLPDGDNDKNVVLRRNGYELSFRYMDADTGGPVDGAPAPEPLVRGEGDEVTIPSPGQIEGYKWSEAEVVQGNPPTLSCDASGKVTGTMPGQDVAVNYKYSRISSGIQFESNGGIPDPGYIPGFAGEPVPLSKMPRVKRDGYIFMGWSSENSRDSDKIVPELPEKFSSELLTYYAIFEPDRGKKKYHYTEDYTNKTGEITFGQQSVKDCSIEEQINCPGKKVKGYVWSAEDSVISPSAYNFPPYQPDPSSDVGKFDEDGSGGFSGKMPGQDLTVHCRYRVDYQETSKSPFKILYETDDGRSIADPHSENVYPEESITAQPKDVYGYKCIRREFICGDEERTTDEGEWVYPVIDGKKDDLSFSGYMPNQEVQLVYRYEPDTKVGYNLTVKYEDSGSQDANLQEIAPRQVSGPYAADSSVSDKYSQFYGYRLASHEVKPDTGTLSFDEQGWSGKMPNGNTAITLSYDRLESQWADVTYKSGPNGSLSNGEGVSPDVKAADDGYRADVLIDDGSPGDSEKCYTLADLEAKGLMPTPQPESKYYRFEGWFIDAGNDGSPAKGKSILPQDYHFTGPVTLTADFEENPDEWIDITFAAGLHVCLTDGAVTALHVKKGTTWGDIAQSLPACSPERHCHLKGWYDGDECVTEATVLAGGHIYTIQYSPDPGYFGTDVAAPEAFAGLNSRGKALVCVYGAALGYKYILTDISSRALSVKKGNLGTSRSVFDGLYPGTRYMAYEASGQTKAAPGDRIMPEPQKISDGIQVLTPVVDDNYRILFEEGDEGKTRLEISPADTASDYAVLDAEGHAVLTPQTGTDGWQKPSGGTPGVSFTGLDYNRDYTVVARPSGQAGVTPESRAKDGTPITVDPGGDSYLPSYIIRTEKGQIKSVGGRPVEKDEYAGAHKGDKVEITADPSDSSGERFLYWEITIGSVEGFRDRIPTSNAVFDMPDGNLVLAAVYTRTATPGNARVEDEVRGGSGRELVLDPDEVPDLENELTTDLDRELMRENSAHVTYKVVYRKTGVSATESNAIKAEGEYDLEHEGAYEGAWGLDVSVERLVNGRKVKPERATGSNADFNTYVQLAEQDVDMADYQLYEINRGSDGEPGVSRVELLCDPEETGGLFTFRAKAGSRYVLIYNRAYRLCFFDNTAPEKYRYCFKVRKGEAPSDPCYRAEYTSLEQPPDSFVGQDGAEYNYVDWSYYKNKLREFDPDRGIRRKTFIYAYYKNNRKEVEEARDELEKEISEAGGICGDYFLKPDESGELKEAIEEARAVLDRAPGAPLGELAETLEKLRESTGLFKEILDQRYEDYWNRQDNGNKGGSSGGGGGGRGTKGSPYNAAPPKSYLVGTNGNWEESKGPDGEKRYSFVLNGGTRLKEMWARLKYPEGGAGDAAGWYHFNGDGFAESGWILDNGNWYYCQTQQEGQYGRMVTGWRADRVDGNWYYLDPSGGAMAQGWRQIDGKWYFFSPAGTGVYAYDPLKQQWTYGGGKGRPMGAMYQSETTADGFWVGVDGAWMQQEETNGKDI